jgi:L-ascorbate metabolism protein UlaG (beta-lactamase superfamily)
VCWLGHASALINFYGLNILTDPVLGERVGISLGLGIAGPKRYIAPALRPKDLPPIDVVLLSHAHYDHMDLPTLQKVASNAIVITAPSTAELLSTVRAKGITELFWKEQTSVKTPKGELQMQAFEVKHWGQRWPNKTPRGYNGYILSREGKSLLFAGDTAFTNRFAEIRAQGPFEIGLFPIGAYRPWIWNHCTPEEALKMANAAGVRYIVPIHHQTFRLSDEPFHEPLGRLQEALHLEPERLALKQIGETFVYPA